MGKPKILTEIIGEYGITQRKKFPIVEDTVEIIKPRGRKSGWRPKFDRNCLLLYQTGRGPFKKIRSKLMVKQGAKSCIGFLGNDGIDIPELNRKTVEDYSWANVIRTAGQTTQKVTVPLPLYILIIMNVALSFIGLALTYFSLRGFRLV